jgi:hypothetical protein
VTTWTTSPTPQKALTSLDGELDAADRELVGALRQPAGRGRNCTAPTV